MTKLVPRLSLFNIPQPEADAAVDRLIASALGDTGGDMLVADFMLYAASYPRP
jgi:hypothetical protein